MPIIIFDYSTQTVLIARYMKTPSKSWERGKKIFFILGGARSGKSRFAVELAKSMSRRVLFIATCVPQDREMRERIKRHIKSRPEKWKTVTVQKKLPEILKNVPESFDVVIIDCLTIFISNLLLSNTKPEKILDRVRELCKIVKSIRQTVILVANEVGCGIVPANKLARVFRDIAGQANQLISEISDKVYMLWSGIPMEIKETGYVKRSD